MWFSAAAEGDDVHFLGKKRPLHSTGADEGFRARGYSIEESSLSYTGDDKLARLCDPDGANASRARERSPDYGGVD
jgi:hypothetical protein